MASGGSAFVLLGLPDPCLLAVLQCLAADDQRSLFSAARTHSRLHQAAVAALHSITVNVVEQQQMDSALLYLDRHGQHVDSIHLFGVEEGTVELRQLPSNLQLSSLQLEHLHLQLQPGSGSHGMLGAAAVALKRLRLSDCKLLDGEEQLAAALSQLPAGLEHLSIVGLTTHGLWVDFPVGELQRLQQLTYLELAEVVLQRPGQGQPALQPLQDLTRLQVLRLCTHNGCVTASMLSGTHCLTRLEVSGRLQDDQEVSVESGVLVGKTQLQHLQLAYCTVPGGAAEVVQLLSHLQPLQQLTHLDMRSSSWALEDGSPPAAAFSTLTASSKLQHLNLSICTLPAGVWQHVFPAGRQLPHLRSLDISLVTHPGSDSRPLVVNPPAPEGSRIVSCCPGLQSMNVQLLQYGADFLPALQGLTGLHTLRLNTHGMRAVCQLTGLRELRVDLPTFSRTESLLQLTQLRQLTALTYNGFFRGVRQTVSLTAEGSGSEPVWRRILLLHLDHSDPGVAQQAAAALAE